MFPLIYSTIKIRDTTTSSASSSAMERSFEKLSMLSAKTSVSAGHSALQNSWYREWKKKDKALVDFVLIDFKNDTCDREEDFAATWRKKHEKKTFGLTTTCMDYFFFFSTTSRLQEKKMKLLFQHEFFTQISDKIFSIGTIISQHSNHRFRHWTPSIT